MEVIAALAGVNSGNVSVSGKTQENPQSFLHRDKVFSSVGEAVMKHVAEIGLAVQRQTKHFRLELVNPISSIPVHTTYMTLQSVKTRDRD